MNPTTIRVKRSLSCSVLAIVLTSTGLTGRSAAEQPKTSALPRPPASLPPGRGDSNSSAIRSASPASREQLTAQVDQNIEAFKQALEAARGQAKFLDEDDKIKLKVAVRDAYTAERRLHKSLKAAQKASAEGWEQARLDLAADYDAYVQAVTQAQRAAAGEPTNIDTTSLFDPR